MTSNPIIIDATGFWIPSDNKGRTLILWKTDTAGWHRFEVGDNLTGNIYGSENLCTGSISELYSIKVFEYITNYSTGFAKSYRCDTDANENCTLNTCSNPNPPMVSNLQFPITNYSSIIPNSVINLNVTPGDGKLIYDWISPGNIFGYYLELIDPWNKVLRGGYLSKNDVNHTFNYLTNNITYTLNIYTLNYSYIVGNKVSLQGTPNSCGVFVAGIDVEDFFFA